MTPSHVMYADDVLVFCKGTKRNLKALMDLMRSYAAVSGQHLSLNKCKFYSSSISPQKSASIANQLGFSAGHLPFNYLGFQFSRESLASCIYSQSLIGSLPN